MTNTVTNSEIQNEIDGLDLSPDEQPLQYQINVSLDPRREIESWCFAALPEDMRHESKLLKAHKDVMDMFIKTPPLFFYIDTVQSNSKDGLVAKGVRLVKRNSLPDKSPCVMVNKTFWTDCPNEDDMYKNCAVISGLFHGMPSEVIDAWCNDKALHFVGVEI